MSLWLDVRVIRKFRVGFFGFSKFRGFENSYPNFAQNKQNPTFRVSDISGSGSGLPEQPELPLLELNAVLPACDAARR